LRTFIKKFLGRILGKSGPPVVAVFLSGNAAASLSMARLMRKLAPDYPHIVIGRRPIDAGAFPDAEEIIEIDSRRLPACWLELRRRLRKRWIALAPFFWEDAGPLRWMPFLLAPRKLLAFNAQLERHHLRLTCPIASWRFLRGVSVGDIFRPTAFAGLKKIPALIGLPLLMACWGLAQLRRRRAKPPAPLPAGGPGVSILPEQAAARLDDAVAQARCDRVLLGPPEAAPALAAALDQPGVWLAFVGPKVALCHGMPVDAETKAGESGTWSLCRKPAAVMFRRDVYWKLGGISRLERAYPEAGWLALSLIGWQRGYRTVAAEPLPLESGFQAASGAERVLLGAAVDFRTAAGILRRCAPSLRRWKAALAAAGAAPPPVPEGRAGRNFLPLLEPGIHAFRGRPPKRGCRVAVVSPYLPFPLSHGGAVRIFNLLRAAARDADLYLLAFAENETGREVEPLLEFCPRVVLVQTPRWEPSPLIRLLPRGVAKFRAQTMRAAIATLCQDERIPVVQFEYTQLAHLRSAAPARTVLVEHDITFDLHRQLRRRARGWEKLPAWLEEARWRRFELGQARRFDRVIAMSQQDRELLETAGIEPRRICVIENGVDLERFQPSPPPAPADEVLFIGSFRHFPNIMAFQFLLERVWPLVRQRLPGIKLTVVAGAGHRYYWRRHTGAGLPSRPEVELLDFVEDVRPLYRRASVVVAPLIVSAGTNIKVMEALAMGRPIVATAAAVAGLGLTPGENVILADTAEAFASSVAELLSNEPARLRMAACGRAFVEERYGWKALGRKQLQLWMEMQVAGADAEIAVPGDGGRPSQYRREQEL
jgi:glycosyltransferase involved in cell wall biosynthesis